MYLHELTTEELKALHGTITFHALRLKYKQPDWCQYPDAISALGCWSLIGNKIHKESDCFSCDLHLKDSKINHQKDDKWIDKGTNIVYTYTGMYWKRSSEK